mgnify:CR=1 FL=1
MNPKPKTSVIEEGFKKATWTRYEDQEFFDRAHGFVNLRNGILDIGNNNLLPHDKERGFRNKIDYAYDETADCPKFKEFLDKAE